MLDRWCREIERDPGEIERSASVQGEPDDVGEQLYAAGTRLFTAYRSGPAYDLARLEPWLAWRDAKNA